MMTIKLKLSSLLWFRLILAVSALIMLRKRKRKRKRKKSIPVTDPETVDKISQAKSMQYAFSTIKAATNDFSDENKFGQGGFGGTLPNGQEIAVKRLSKNSGQGDLEFKNEVRLLAKLQHRNLVRLTIQGKEKLLVYEFVQNASLDLFIFDPIKSSYLEWDRHYKIIRGVARGIMYLHEDSRLKIIHRDLKASNVLLDGDMNPKIADFGMARLFGQDETQGNTSKIVGTYGYMSPEYAMHGEFSIKSDVFSFGVILLEIISGQRNRCMDSSHSMEDLLTRTWKTWKDGSGEKMIDPVVLNNGRDNFHDILRCIQLGLLCVQENAATRPTMTNVVLMLSSARVTMGVPSEPAFYAASRFGPDASQLDDSKTNSSQASTANAGISEGLSRNDMSITELYPR